VHELLAESSALVVWDMQVGIATRATNYAQLLDTLPRLIAAARARATPIIYSQHYSLPMEMEDRVWIRTMWQRAGGDPNDLKPTVPVGSPAWQFVSETAPTPGDAIVPKTRATFFAGTPLQTLLAGRNIDVMVMVGVATDRGVIATAREAVHRGVFTVVVTNAVGSFTEQDQQRGLQDLASICDLCSAEDVLAAWA
jgi:nicotinamidase-related amidase